MHACIALWLVIALPNFPEPPSEPLAVKLERRIQQIDDRVKRLEYNSTKTYKAEDYTEVQAVFKRVVGRFDKRAEEEANTDKFEYIKLVQTVYQFADRDYSRKKGQYEYKPGVFGYRLIYLIKSKSDDFPVVRLGPHLDPGDSYEPAKYESNFNIQLQNGWKVVSSTASGISFRYGKNWERSYAGAYVGVGTNNENNVITLSMPRRHNHDETFKSDDHGNHGCHKVELSLWVLKEDAQQD